VKSEAWAEFPGIPALLIARTIALVMRIKPWCFMIAKRFSEDGC
jgi:hypothetical protein